VFFKLKSKKVIITSLSLLRVKELSAFFILVFVSVSVCSSELSGFEKNLDMIKYNSEYSANKKHLAIYQHTLTLGSYGVDYLSSRQSVNGFFLTLVKDSWDAYIAASDLLLKSSRRGFSGREALAELYLIERTQMLYDKYMESRATRFILKDQSTMIDNKIEEFIGRILSRSNRDKIPILIDVVLRKKPSGYEDSIIYNKFYNQESLNGFAKLDYFFSDILANIFFVSTRSISRSFGAVVGPVEWSRNARIGSASQKQILAKLRPLDIIFEKKTNKLTDYLIPGYWGHNAVWLGTKEQLIELGIWGAKELEPFREKIESGFSIIEMRRHGAAFSRFHEWIDMDAFASIRVKGLLDKPEKNILKVFSNLNEQAGKEYDFGFNVDSAAKVTCSEVVYLSYGDYKWPTKNVLGRATVGPNEIAELIFYKDSPLELIAFVTSDDNDMAEFQRKEVLADLMGFNLQQDGTFKKRYKVCDVDKTIHSRKSMRIKRRCVEKEKYLYI